MVAIQRQLPVLMLLLLFTGYMQFALIQRSMVSGLSVLDNETDLFREQRVSAELSDDLDKAVANKKGSFVSLLAISMMMEGYKPRAVHTDDHLLHKYKPQAYKEITETYRSIWEDLQYFPVASTETSFEDTWMSRRGSQSNPRKHEGCDIFGKRNVKGYYPIVSMTDGIVENVGWLPLGGYRIGIRSPHGGYFYYAHLSSYGKDFQEGDWIYAGEILGFMGDTGYGQEGTIGKFPVHLHLGIYIKTEHYDELSINPYWILRYIHKNIINYAY